MDVEDEKLQIIETIYQCLNIYRSLFIYKDEHEFKTLYNKMINLDYTFKNVKNDVCNDPCNDPCKDPCNQQVDGRIYAISTKDENVDVYDNIEYDSISFIFCLGAEPLEYAKTLVYRRQFNNLRGIFRL